VSVSFSFLFFFFFFGDGNSIVLELSTYTALETWEHTVPVEVFLILLHKEDV